MRVSDVDFEENTVGACEVKPAAAKPAAAKPAAKAAKKGTASRSRAKS